MKNLTRIIVAIGAIDLVAALALYFGGRFMLGFAWLGAFDLYVALDKEDIIDHAKLAVEYPALAGHYALGHRLIDVPTSAGYELITLGAVALALSGITLLIAAALTRKKPGAQALPAAPGDTVSPNVPTGT